MFFRALALSGLCWLLSATSQAAPIQQKTQTTPATAIPSLIATLTSPDLSFPTRFKAEQQLLKAPAEEVLSALIPIDNAMPEFGMWSGSGSAQLDARMGMPPRWQILYAINRVWNEHARAIYDDQSVRVRIAQQLLEFLPRSKNQHRVLDQISLDFWIPEAEPVFARLLDSKGEGEVAFGAKVLSEKVGDKYHEQILKALRAPLSSHNSGGNSKRSLFGALIFPRVTQTDGSMAPASQRPLADLDMRAIETGFEILKQLEERSPGGGYFFAASLGAAVQQDFDPDQKLAKYRNGDNLAPSFFRTRAATRWSGGRRTKTRLKIYNLETRAQFSD